MRTSLLFILIALLSTACTAADPTEDDLWTGSPTAMDGGPDDRPDTGTTPDPFAAPDPYCGDFRCSDHERDQGDCPDDCGGPAADWCGDRVPVSPSPLLIELPEILTNVADLDAIAALLGRSGTIALDLDGLPRGLNENELQIELSNGRPVIAGFQSEGGPHTLIVHGFSGQTDGLVAEYDLTDPRDGWHTRASYHSLTFGAGTGTGIDLWTETRYRLLEPDHHCD